MESGLFIGEPSLRFSLNEVFSVNHLRRPLPGPYAYSFSYDTVKIEQIDYPDEC